MNEEATPPVKASRRDVTHQRFQRVAERRTNQVMEKLRVLGNCASPYQYSYSEEEVAKVFTAIEAEVERVRALFEPQKREKPQRFSF
jgi:hypothetical protein